ncbi:phosphoribosylanthranilate isomerase [Butyribacter sp.]|uniref:phosphoribosylanthranilate isomerase n=1 Tax=Butyribacter sp. TaxID=2822465 RepID=UPI002A9D3270|nr:phosphoribosylanthranilate isomerase [Butyribacter sp.]
MGKLIDLNTTMIKVCGLTEVREAEYLNRLKIDFAGFVLFFPKSKRNISIEKAEEIMKHLDKNIKKTAVVVSPAKEQIIDICNSGFDYIQIHGKIEEEVLKMAQIPVLKAFNVDDMDEFKMYSSNEKIAGYVFDAAEPGSGRTFDWDILSQIERDGKLFILAGGLNPDNVRKAVAAVNPDMVDVSSGVENDDGFGKDILKIEKIVKQIRN